jgi:hypothetical protein
MYVKAYVLAQDDVLLIPCCCKCGTGTDVLHLLQSILTVILKNKKQNGRLKTLWYSRCNSYNSYEVCSEFPCRFLTQNPGKKLL